MYSQTEIANIALSHLGVAKEIAAIDEKGQEAAAVRRYWSIALGQVLRDFAWPFATAYVNLGLVQEFPPNQNYEYHFSYRRPVDAVTIRHIYSGLRRDTADTMIPFTESSDVDGLLILTDARNARVEYTKMMDNPAYFPADFVMMLSYMLGSLIAPRLAGGDPFKRGEACQQNYFYSLSVARANAINERQEGQNLESEFIRARDL